jgi:hypothetical protein
MPAFFKMNFLNLARLKTELVENHPHDLPEFNQAVLI